MADVYAGNVLYRNYLSVISGCEKAAFDELVCIVDSGASKPRCVACEGADLDDIALDWRAIRYV